MVWLTVVTTFGMIGTITTGYFGMNILSADVFGAGEPAFLYKLLFFVGVLAGTILLLVFTIARSKRLSDFLDTLSDDRVPVTTKIVAFWRVWFGEKSSTAA